MNEAITFLGRFRIEKYQDSRFFALYDLDELVAVCVYKKGAKEIERRMIGYELALLQIENERG